MDVLKALYERRSIKEFDPMHKISSDDLSTLLDAARQAPSSYNLQHTKIVRIVDREMRKKISAAAYNQPQVLSASELFVLAADTKAWQKKPERCWQNVPEKIRNFILKSIPEFHQNRPWIERDEAIRSASLMAMAIMLAAKSMGYDSCPMIGFEQEPVKEAIQLPNDHVLVMLLAIGKGVKPPYPKPGFIPMEEFLFLDHF